MIRPLVAVAVVLLFPVAASAQGADSTGAALVYELKQVDEPPQLRDVAGCVAAQDEHYPGREARRTHTGRVVFSFIIDTDGWVEEKSVAVLSASDQHFVGPARLVLLDRRCRYLPAKKNGQPVRVRAEQAFSWQLRR